MGGLGSCLCEVCQFQMASMQPRPPTVLLECTCGAVSLVMMASAGTLKLVFISVELPSVPVIAASLGWQRAACQNAAYADIAIMPPPILSWSGMHPGCSRQLGQESVECSEPPPALVALQPVLTSGRAPASPPPSVSPQTLFHQNTVLTGSRARRCDQHTVTVARGAQGQSLENGTNKTHPLLADGLERLRTAESQSGRRVFSYQGGWQLMQNHPLFC